MIPTLLRLLGITAAIYLLWRWLTSKKQSPAGADSSAKNPDLWDSMQEHFQQRDRELEQAKHWSDGEVALAVEQYVFKLKHSDDDVHDVRNKLAQQPGKAAKIALRTTLDPDMQSRLRKEPKGEPALYRACQLLMLEPPPEAAAQVHRLLTARDEDVRRKAIGWLAEIGDATYVDDLITALHGDNEDDCWTVLNSLVTARHAPGSRVAIDLLRPVLELFRREFEDTSQFELVATLVLEWDRDRAGAHFEAASVLAPAHAAFAEVLKLMLEKDVRLPRPKLLELWLSIDGPTASQFDVQPVLLMLADHRCDEDESMLREVLDRDHPTAAAGATAMLHFHGLKDWVATVQARPERTRGEAEQRAMALHRYDEEVRRGGHTRYFLNQNGNDWQTALKALDQAGDTTRAKVLRDAMAKFDSTQSFDSTQQFDSAQTLDSTLSDDRDARQQQLAQIKALSNDAFDEVDRRYYAEPQPCEVSLARLVLATPDVFRA